MECSVRRKYISPIHLFILSLLTQSVIGLQCTLSTSSDLGPGDKFEDKDNPQLGVISLVKNNSITASSYKPGFEPWRVRNTEGIEFNSLAWCPTKKVDMSSYEWVQIDYEDQKNFTLIRTTGNFDEADGREYTPYFRLEYSRGVDTQFQPYINENGEQMFDGNTNTRMTKFNTLKPAMVARRVRIIPLATIPTETCIQVVFSGCDLNTGISEYSTDPPVTPTEIDGVTYSDFINSQIHQKYGPGKLADGNVYQSTDSWLQKNGVVFKPVSPTLTIRISLDNYRALQHVNILGVQNQHFKIFSEARLFYAVHDESSYQFLYSTSPRLDGNSEYNISILNNNQQNTVITRYIKIELDHTDNMLLHEIQILSLNANPPSLTTPVSEIQTGSSVDAQRTVNPPKTTGSGGSVTEDVNEGGKPVDYTMIGIIVGVCSFVILLAAVIVGVCCVCHRRRKQQNTPSESPSFTHHNVASFTNIPGFNKSYNGVPTQSDSDKPENSVYGHGVPWSRPLPHVPPYHQSSPLHQTASSGYVSDGAHYDSIPVDGSQGAANLYTANEMMPPCLACQTLNQHQKQHPHINKHNRTLPPSYPQHHMNGGHPLSHNGGSSSLILGGEPSCQPYQVVQAPVHNCQPFDISNYRTNPVNNFPQIQGASGTSLYGTSNSVKIQQSLNSQNIELDVIPPNNLTFLELIGKGQHGEVHLARYSPSLNTSKERLVAVKSLVTQADDSAKQDFHREIRIMSRLNHENIVKVLGLCSRDGLSNSSSQSVVTEYMCMGDLHEFLKQHKPESEAFTGDEHKDVLSRGCLLHISSQIADGMRYLEELNVTHRDLAARNCLVGKNYQVKISDFGMSRSLYSQQYYKLEGQTMLPIRWMAWESVVHGRFTLKSDSWSFGVLLWEIFTFCREQPYSQLTDEQVISNCMKVSEVFYNRRTAPVENIIKLHQPITCSKEMYDLWLACWAPFDSARPPFHEISLFLKRKNLGYNPLDEHNLHRLTSL